MMVAAGTLFAKIVASIPEPDDEPRVPATPREWDEDEFDESTDPIEDFGDDEDLP